LADSYVLYARVKHALGDVPGAREYMDKAAQLGREGQVVGLTIRQIEAHQARLWLASGDLDAAERWAEEREQDRKVEHEVDGQMHLFVRGLEERILAQLYVAQGRYEQATRLLALLLEALDAAGWTGVVIEVLSLQSLAQQGQGHADESLETLHRALSLAEPEGFARIFLDQGQPMARLLSTYRARRATSEGLRPYAERLLAAFERERAVLDRRHASTSNLKPETWVTQNVGLETDRPALIEPLTDREREVLSLVVAGLSNREIADRLTVTLGTAKRHVSNIYAKLGVHSRVQAVARARELGL
jgi:LuxR family maltose regulon positive regulatory protein